MRWDRYEIVKCPEGQGKEYVGQPSMHIGEVSRIIEASVSYYAPLQRKWRGRGGVIVVCCCGVDDRVAAEPAEDH